jgi:hypothetical protein
MSPELGLVHDGHVVSGLEFGMTIQRWKRRTMSGKNKDMSHNECVWIAHNRDKV